MPDTIPPVNKVIKTADELDRAISLAVSGNALSLDPSLVYPAPLRLDKAISLQSTVPRTTHSLDPLGRMKLDIPAPKFLRGMTLGNGVSIYGLEAQDFSHQGATVVSIHGSHVWVDGNRILAEPSRGTKRGIAANGGGDVTIVGNHIGDFFGPFPGDDTQAICAWDMLPGLLIQNNYACGASEGIMIGGSDPSSEVRLPTSGIIRGNTITKRPEWQFRLKPIGVKTGIELKNAIDFIIEDNDITYSWGAHGQDGYLVTFTVRNQGNTAPYSTIRGIRFHKNRCSKGAAAINILGTDDKNPSRVMQVVSITENEFTDLDPDLWTSVASKPGSRKMIQVDGSPEDLGIENNKFSGKGMTSVIYFAGGRCWQMDVDGNSWPKTKYGIFGSNSTIGKAWGQYVETGTLGMNVET